MTKGKHKKHKTAQARNHQLSDDRNIKTKIGIKTANFKIFKSNFSGIDIFLLALSIRSNLSFSGNSASSGRLLLLKINFINISVDLIKFRRHYRVFEGRQLVIVKP